jgi:hypothetical protein
MIVSKRFYFYDKNYQFLHKIVSQLEPLSISSGRKNRSENGQNSTKKNCKNTKMIFVEQPTVLPILFFFHANSQKKFTNFHEIFFLTTNKTTLEKNNAQKSLSWTSQQNFRIQCCQIHDFSREFTKFHTLSREFTDFHEIFFLPVRTANNAKIASHGLFHRKSFIFPIRGGYMESIRVLTFC